MDGGWFEPIRAYCERTDGAFWAEPLNAVSNGAFLMAAAAAGLRARAAEDAPALGLAALVAVVGIGSFLFHTIANFAAMLADVIPIAAFIYAYFLLAMRRYFGLSAVAASLVTLGFAGFNVGFTPALEALTGYPIGMFTNRSSEYVPAMLALFGVGAGLLVPGIRGTDERRATGRRILGIGGVFLISLVFRTIDTAMCPRWTPGTHFLWHLLNAAVLYGLIVVAVRFREGGRRSRSSDPVPSS